MENQLRFEIECKPYTNSENTEISILKNWGQIKILVLIDTDKVLLLDYQWNLSELARWFADNQEFLRSEHLSIFGRFSTCPGESLAQALKRLQDQDFLDQEQEAYEDWYNELYKFRERHALRFAMRGANIPNIIIGTNRESGEISLSDDDNEWCYLFDMNDFLNDAQTKLEIAINKCSAS
jgi:hypothetical protein